MVQPRHEHRGHEHHYQAAQEPVTEGIVTDASGTGSRSGPADSDAPSPITSAKSSKRKVHSAEEDEDQRPGENAG